MTAPLNSSDPSRQTFLEEGTAFHGTVRSSCPIVVSGSIEGTVDAPEITINPLGSILGAIKADKLTSSGTLSGKIDAVHVFLSGSVLSKTVVRAERLDFNIRSERGQLEVTFGPPREDAGGDEAKAPEGASAWSGPAENAPVEGRPETRRGRRAQRHQGRQQNR